MSISLKAARVNAELSRPAVIARLKNEMGITLTVGTLANYENKVTQPGIDIGKALASIYGIPVNDIRFS
jgi:hypothetical protein